MNQIIHKIKSRDESVLDDLKHMTALKTKLAEDEFIITHSILAKFKKCTDFLIKTKKFPLNSLYSKGTFAKSSFISNCSVFHNMIHKKFKTRINFFIMHGADLNEIGINHQTLLFNMIAQCSDTSFDQSLHNIIYLLQKGADPNKSICSIQSCIFSNFQLSIMHKVELVFVCCLFGMDLFQKDLFDKSAFDYFYCQFRSDDNQHIRSYWAMQYPKYVDRFSLDKLAPLSDSKDSWANEEFICGADPTYQLEVVVLDNKWAFHMSEIPHLLISGFNPFTTIPFSKNQKKKLLKSNIIPTMEIAMKTLNSIFTIKSIPCNYRNTLRYLLDPIFPYYTLIDNIHCFQPFFCDYFYFIHDYKIIKRLCNQCLYTKIDTHVSILHDINDFLDCCWIFEQYFQYIEKTSNDIRDDITIILFCNDEFRKREVLEKYRHSLVRYHASYLNLNTK